MCPDKGFVVLDLDGQRIDAQICVDSRRDVRDLDRLVLDVGVVRGGDLDGLLGIPVRGGEGQRCRIDRDVASSVRGDGDRDRCIGLAVEHRGVGPALRIALHDGDLALVEAHRHAVVVVDGYRERFQGDNIVVAPACAGVAHGVGFVRVVVVGRGLHGDGLWGFPVGGGEGEARGADRDQRAGRGFDGHRHVGGWERFQVHRVLFSGWVFFRDCQLRLAKGNVDAVGIDHDNRDRRCCDRVVVRTGDGVGDGGARVFGVGVCGGAHLDGLGDVPIGVGEGERGGA